MYRSPSFNQCTCNLRLRTIFLLERFINYMSERKTIQINPELFKVSNNTRKKRTNDEKEPAKIQIKSSFKKQKQKTLRKNVLKMIREKQQEAYRDLFDNKKKAVTPSPSISNDENTFNKGFDDSLEFFSSLATKIDANEKPSMNTTFKNMNSIQIQPSMINIPQEPFVNTTLPEVFMELPSNEKPLVIPSVPRIMPPPPSYGCLKGGSLPTYRSYTRHISNNSLSNNTGSFTPINNTESYTPPSFVTPLSFVEKPNAPSVSEIERSKKFEKLHGGMINMKKSNENKIKYLKRKKIFKRTYHVGRTKGAVGVLVSNKTIRTRISTEAQLLKQTPIQDVRKFLIKKGFIKVGTNAPNDVLRKMYESVSLVCGEIQNHNPENLLFNFIHDTV